MRSTALVLITVRLNSVLRTYLRTRKFQNPRPRKPRKSKRLSVSDQSLPTKDLEKLMVLELDEEIQVSEGGRTVPMTKYQAIVIGFVHGAVKGNHKDRQLLLNIMKNHRDIDVFEMDETDQQALNELFERQQTMLDSK